MGKLIIIAVMSLLLLGAVVAESTDVCLGFDCLENVVCPPDSSIDDDYYDDDISFADTDLINEHSSERHIPPRFQRSSDNLFNKCCRIDKICKCNPCPKPPTCANSTHIPIRVRVAAKSPGDCCDTYECRPKPNCSEEPNATWRTVCKDCRCISGEEFCTMIENCEFQPEKQPAACLSSEHNKIFEHGDEWKESDDCMDCQCSHGERKCIQTDCKVPECENPVKIPGQCCKVCVEVPSTEKAVTDEPAGCFSTTMQRIFNHGEEWREADSCMDCRCENGDIKCQSSFCKPLDCEETVKIPGQCCRVCANVTVPPTTTDGIEESPTENLFFRYDNILFIYAIILLPIILGTVFFCFCCRRHHHTIGKCMDKGYEWFCCCHHPHGDVKFVATTNKYSTIQQSESTVTTAPSTPTMR